MEKMAIRPVMSRYYCCHQRYDQHAASPPTCPGLIGDQINRVCVQCGHRGDVFVDQWEGKPRAARFGGVANRVRWCADGAIAKGISIARVRYAIQLKNGKYHETGTLRSQRLRPLSGEQISAKFRVLRARLCRQKAWRRSKKSFGLEMQPRVEAVERCG